MASWYRPKCEGKETRKLVDPAPRQERAPDEETRYLMNELFSVAEMPLTGEGPGRDACCRVCSGRKGRIGPNFYGLSLNTDQSRYVLQGSRQATMFTGSLTSAPVSYEFSVVAVCMHCSA